MTAQPSPSAAPDAGGDLPAALVTQAEAAHQALLALWQAAQAAQETLPAETGAAATVQLAWTPGTSPRQLALSAWQLAEEQAARQAPVQPGRVYCHHCAGTTCAHALPDTTGAVFTGYDSHGRPRWRELFNALLAWEDRRVGELFDDHPPLLGRVLGRATLIAEQMVAFGRNSLTYRIIGQVVGGYFTVGDEHHALTVQVIEGADRHLRAQLLGSPRLLAALPEADPRREPTMARVHAAWRKFRQEVQALDGTWRASPRREQRRALEDRLFQHLRRFLAALEQRGRQALRRTDHADQRAGDRRPAHTALDDLRRAADEHFFRDRKTWCVAVLGARGRVHVFNDAGRHITSLVLTGDQLTRRQAQRRFVPLPGDQTRALRQRAEHPTPPGATSEANQPDTPAPGA